MKEKILYAIWACFYILCVGLGTLTQITPAGKVVLVILSLLFFLPGALLLKEALDTHSRAGLLRIRVICLSSLLLTLTLLIANIASANASPEVGAILYDLLLLVSAPMICAQYWVLSLFCWACLLIASFPKLWKASKATPPESSAGRT